MFALLPSRERARPTRWETPFRMLREEFAPLFERLFATEPFYPFEGHEWLTTNETETEWIVRAELPGFEPKELEVVLHGPELTIEAKHTEETEPTEKPETETTARYAHVRRTFTLPEGLETEKAAATYRNGVLEVHIPKGPKAVGRRVEVKT